MGRSTNIYVVENDDDLAMAVFTVKKKCFEYLSKKSVEERALLTVQRFREGERVQDIVPAEEFVAGYKSR